MGTGSKEKKRQVMARKMEWGRSREKGWWQEDWISCLPRSEHIGLNKCASCNRLTHINPHHSLHQWRNYQGNLTETDAPPQLCLSVCVCWSQRHSYALIKPSILSSVCPSVCPTRVVGQASRRSSVPVPQRLACLPPPMSARKLRAKEIPTALTADPHPSWLSALHTQIGGESDNYRGT